MKKLILIEFTLILFLTINTGVAQVIFTDVIPDAVLNQVVAGSVTYDLDMNNDDTMDYQIINSYAMVGDTIYSKTIAVPDSGNEVAADANKYPLALLQDTLIGSNLNYVSNGLGPLKQIKSAFGANPSFSGNWIDGNNRYLGVHFRDQGNMKYGWVKMQMDENQLTVATTIFSYAYESSGAAIVAFDSSTVIGIPSVSGIEIPEIYSFNNSVIINYKGTLTEPLFITLMDVAGHKLQNFRANDHHSVINFPSSAGSILLITARVGNITVTKKILIN